jgi:hypothetical protein
MIKLFESKKKNAYVGLSSDEKKEIIKEAIKKANVEQAIVVSKYGTGKHEKCLMNS